MFTNSITQKVFSETNLETYIKLENVSIKYPPCSLYWFREYFRILNCRAVDIDQDFINHTVTFKLIGRIKSTKSFEEFMSRRCPVGVIAKFIWLDRGREGAKMYLLKRLGIRGQQSIKMYLLNLLKIKVGLF